LHYLHYLHLVNETIGFSTEYKERETDPLERLANLKVEIIDVKKELEEYSDKVNIHSNSVYS